MNKAELLAYLLTKPQIISLSDPAEIEEIYGYKKYIVSAIVSTNVDAMTMQNIGFYENIETSECLFMNSEPFIERDPTFIQKVIIKIGELMTAGTIKAGFLGVIDAVNNTVIVTVVMPDLTRPELLVFQKPDGSLDYIALS